MSQLSAFEFPLFKCAWEQTAAELCSPLYCKTCTTLIPVPEAHGCISRLYRQNPVWQDIVSSSLVRHSWFVYPQGRLRWWEWPSLWATPPPFIMKTSYGRSSRHRQRGPQSWGPEARREPWTDVTDGKRGMGRQGALLLQRQIHRCAQGVSTSSLGTWSFSGHVWRQSIATMPVDSQKHSVKGAYESAMNHLPSLFCKTVWETGQPGDLDVLTQHLPEKWVHFRPEKPLPSLWIMSTHI